MTKTKKLVWKKSRTIVQISFLCPSPKHTQKRNKTSHITTYSESSSSSSSSTSSSSSRFLACLTFLCFLCTTSWCVLQFFFFGLSGAFLFPFWSCFFTSASQSFFSSHFSKSGKPRVQLLFISHKSSVERQSSSWFSQSHMSGYSCAHRNSGLQYW